MSEEKLLPCPFCGSKSVRPYNIEGLAMVACEKCCAKTSFFHEKAKAIDAWNRRVEAWNAKQEAPK